MTITKSDNKKPSAIESSISIIITFLFTTFCWIFFRADSLSHALSIIGRIFSFDSGLEQPYMWFFISAIILIVANIVAYLQAKKKRDKTKKQNVSLVEGFYPLVELSSFWGLVIFFVFCGLILCFAYTGGSPFIYGNY